MKMKSSGMLFFISKGKLHTFIYCTFKSVCLVLSILAVSFTAALSNPLQGTPKWSTRAKAPFRQTLRSVNLQQTSITKEKCELHNRLVSGCQRLQGVASNLQSSQDRLTFMSVFVYIFRKEVTTEQYVYRPCLDFAILSSVNRRRLLQRLTISLSFNQHIAYFILLLFYVLTSLLLSALCESQSGTYPAPQPRRLMLS